MVRNNNNNFMMIIRLNYHLRINLNLILLLPTIFSIKVAQENIYIFSKTIVKNFDILI